jgi:hypothetical protein
LGDCHRRDRINQLRVERAEQGGRNLREFVAEIKLQARRQKGEGLNQPFDVWIGTLVVADFEPRRELRILLLKLPACATQVAQFVSIKLQQFISIARSHIFP